MVWWTGGQDRVTDTDEKMLGIFLLPRLLGCVVGVGAEVIIYNNQIGL